MTDKKEAGDFADKKREEQGHGVIVAGPDAHANEKDGASPSDTPAGREEKSSSDRPGPSADRR